MLKGMVGFGGWGDEKGYCGSELVVIDNRFGLKLLIVGDRLFWWFGFINLMKMFFRKLRFVYGGDFSCCCWVFGVVLY